MAFQSDTSYLDRTSQSSDDYSHGVEFIYSGKPFVAGLPASWNNYLGDNTNTRAWQQEFRLSSQDPSSRVSWVAGLYYRHAVQGFFQCDPGSNDPLFEAINGENTLQFTGLHNYVLPGGQVCNAYDNYQATDISEAAFGDVTVNVVAGLKVDVGVRVEHATVEHQNELTAGPGNGLNFAYQVLPDQTGNPVTPRISISYQINDSDMVYASAAKGYRAGGGNSDAEIGNPLCTSSVTALGLKAVPSSFNSDSLWSYEIGTKDWLFDRRLNIQASAFLIDWSDIQTQVLLPSCGFSFTANRGNAVSRGFDFQAAAVITDGLKAGLNVGYTDAYYPNASFGAPVNGVPPLLNAAGDKLANVVPWTATANVEYSWDVGTIWPNARSYLRADYRWLGAADALDPRVANYDPETGPIQNPAYGILNLRVGVTHEGLDLSAYVNNATRADPTLGFTHDATGDPLFYGAAIRPLTAGFTLYYRY